MPIRWKLKYQTTLKESSYPCGRGSSIVKKRVYPAIIGGVVGDALGVPVEFNERDTYKIESMVGYGTYNQPEGTWSDDTSLTMCLIENIIERGGSSKLLEKFNKYLNEGYWTPYGKVFDIGRTTVDAIRRYNLGYEPSKCGGVTEGDNGNGALMRIMPLVFILWNDEENLVKKVEEVAEVTHRHPRSTLGCIIYTKFMIELFKNMPIDKAYDNTIGYINNTVSKLNKYKSEIEFYKRVLNKSLFTIARDNIKSDGYVVNTLEAALWCFVNSNSYKEAVLKAVNLGDDTDTVAFITGTIAGLYYKFDDIPEKWIDKLAQKERIIDACERFYKFVANKDEYSSQYCITD